MNCRLRNSIVGGLALTLALAFGGRPAAASNINDLQATYAGAQHSTTSAENEDLPVGLAVTSHTANGKFAGVFDDVPITGKVSSKGVVTFSGKLTANPEGSANGVGPTGTATITKGKALLSATGQFIVGSFTYKGTGGLAAQSGKYIFGVAIPPNAAPLAGAGVGINAQPSDLGDRYLGRAHNSTRPETENLVFDVTILTQNSRGKITAILGATQITGKVSSTGKVTFKGKLTNSAGTFKGSGTGQLSATGRFFYGAIKAKATGDFAAQGGTSSFEAAVFTNEPTSQSGAGTGAPTLGGSR